MSDIRRAIEVFSQSIPAGSMILDVGCGLRPYEDCFPLSKYIGIDVPVSGREGLPARALTMSLMEPIYRWNPNISMW